MKYLVISALVCASLGVMGKTTELKSCSQTREARAVIFVTADWCSTCKTYKPIFKRLSNDPEMKDYKFYIKTNNSGGKVCGKVIFGVPFLIMGDGRRVASGMLPYHRMKAWIRRSR